MPHVVVPFMRQKRQELHLFLGMMLGMMLGMLLLLLRITFGDVLKVRFCAAQDRPQWALWVVTSKLSFGGVHPVEDRPGGMTTQLGMFVMWGVLVVLMFITVVGEQLIEHTELGMMALIQGLGWEPRLLNEVHVVALIVLFPAVSPMRFLLLLVVSLCVMTIMRLGWVVVTVSMAWPDVFGVIFMSRPVFVSPVVVVQRVLVGANPPYCGWVLILLLAQVNVTLDLPLGLLCLLRLLVRLLVETSRPSEQQRGPSVWISRPALFLTVTIVLGVEPVVLLAFCVQLVDFLLDDALEPDGLDGEDTRVYASGVVLVDGLYEDPRLRPEVVIVPDNGVATPRERLMLHIAYCTISWGFWSIMRGLDAHQAVPQMARTTIMHSLLSTLTYKINMSLPRSYCLQKALFRFLRRALAVICPKF